jgi:uncharacterized protein YjbJ (UPF0337 family)
MENFKENFNEYRNYFGYRLDRVPTWWRWLVLGSRPRLTRRLWDSRWPLSSQNRVLAGGNGRKLFADEDAGIQVPHQVGDKVRHCRYRSQGGLRPMPDDSRKPSLCIWSGELSAVSSAGRGSTVPSTGRFSTIRRRPMSASTKDEIKGTFHEVKGEIKDKVGQVTSNPDLEAEGKAENKAGKVEKKVGQIKKVFEK